MTELTVLIVDDDPQLRVVFAEFLKDSYEILTAESGQEALEMMTDDVDVVLLDRRMPGKHGDEVLKDLRDQGFEQPVALVTAVEPDFDILDLGFDDYVLKPVQGDELRDLVQTLALRHDYDHVMREYFSLITKVTTLHAQKNEGELVGDDNFKAATKRLDEIKHHAREAINTAIESGKFDELFLELYEDQELHDPPNVESDKRNR